MKETRHSKHYFRAAFLLVAAFLAFLIVRALIVPSSFGEFGFFRGDAVREQMAKAITFAGATSCQDCHAKVAQIHATHAHQNVPCQSCHAPLTVHIDQGEFKDAMPINRSPALCLRCHRNLPSRPKDFPQINVKEHTNQYEQELASGFCLQCHPPHDPSPGGHNE